MEFPPYYGEGLPEKGFICEIVTTAFNMLGYEVYIEVVPWKRAYEKTKSGEYDGIITLLYRKDREKWFLYSDPFPPIQSSFYKRKGFHNPSACTYEALKDFKIGIVRGYANAPELDAILDKLDYEEVPNDHNNLLRLYRGRVDYIYIDVNVAQYIINTQLPQLKGELEPVSPMIFSPENHYIGISRQNPNAEKIISEFNKIFTSMYNEGIIDSIMEKHGLLFSN